MTACEELGVASTYGTNSELACSDFGDSLISEGRGVQKMPQDLHGKTSVFESPDVLSETSREREAVLWATLSSLGITPKEHAHLD